MPSIERIPVALLQPDQHNPRLDQTDTSGLDALIGIIRDQDEKIVNLACDIAKHGLSPSELLLALKGDTTKYVVLEGNRRTTALKLLNNPDLADGILKERQIRQIRQAAAASDQDLSSAWCNVVESRAEANLWIARRHSGQQGGIGIVDWSPLERARFEQTQLGKPDPTLQIYEVVWRNADLDDATRLSMKSLKFTNLERFVDDQQIRRLLGIEVIKGTVYTSLGRDQVLPALHRVVKLVADGISVTEIEDATARLNKVLGAARLVLPHPNAPRGELVELAEAPETLGPVPDGEEQNTPTATASLEHRVSQEGQGRDAHGETATPAGEQSTSTAAEGYIVSSGPGSSGVAPAASPPSGRRAAAPRSARSPAERRALIPKACKLYIPPPRINSIYDELRRVQVETFPNGTAVLFRVFLELSVDHYLAANHIMIDERTKLRDKVGRTRTHLIDSGALTKSALVPVERLINSERLMPASIVSLNAYVHNPNMIPLPSELKAAWDSVEFFFRELWPSRQRFGT